MQDKLFQSGELEFAYDTTFERVAVTMATRFNVYVKVVKEHTSQGWPEVVLIGDINDVARAVRECWESGDEETDQEVFAFALGKGEFMEGWD